MTAKSFIKKNTAHLILIGTVLLISIVTGIFSSGIFDPASKGYLDWYQLFKDTFLGMPLVFLGIFYFGYFLTYAAYKKKLIIGGFVLVALFLLFIYISTPEREDFTKFERLSMVLSIMAFFFIPFAGGLTKFMVERRKSERLLKELKNQNERSELSLLKAQTSPHFIYNTLHNIDALIEKSPQKASASIIKLSEIMRYASYEASSEFVPIVREAEYLENYVSLLKLRLDNPNAIDFVGRIGDCELEIAPMLLIPFAENAYKHGADRKSDSAIKISLTLENGLLRFDCSNAYDPEKPREFADRGGIGLANVRRRLELIYPGKHKLEIDSKNDKFVVALEIDLNRNEN